MNVDRAATILKHCNLLVNATKSFSLTIKIDGKNKLSKIVESVIKVDLNPLPAIKINDEFKYLGVKFSAAGLVQANPAVTNLELLNKAKLFPLKPNQKMFVLNNFLIPRLFHTAVLTRSTLAVLRKADIHIREFVGSTLHLPKDCTYAYIHSNVGDGGLGVVSLRATIPELRSKRLEKLRKILALDALMG